MQKVIENHNKSIQMKWINSIRELPKHKDLSCAGEDDFNLPIVKISPSQKSNLKKTNTMSKFEGTKGKWEFVETNQHPTEENEYHSVVQMPKIAISITNTKFLSKKETKANAKLIAAAPDLLEALQNANNVLKMASLIDKTNTCSEAQIICENAIKKATE